MTIESLMLPWVTQPSIDDGTNTIRWTTSSTATHVDAVVVNLKFNSSDGRELAWEILAPYQGNEFHLPQIPASSPFAGAPVSINSLKLIAITGGYAKLRSVPLDAIGTLLTHGGTFAISTPED
jgi:hypothetical protein